MNCQKITAYYDGTFQWPADRSKLFYGQIQLTIDVNLQDKQVYFKFDKWNKALADIYGFNIFDKTSSIQ
jgi:hypothetical protein